VREHARIELRKLGAEVVPAVDAWIGGMEPNAGVYEQALLEAVWVLHSKSQTRLEWLKKLMQSREPRMRAAAVQMVRFQGSQIPEAKTFLRGAARDSHPRVRMAVVNAVSHLRAELRAPAHLAAVGTHAGHGAGLHGSGVLEWESVLEGMGAEEPAVRQMVLDLKAGTQPTKGRSVPVLEVNPATEVLQWLLAKNLSAGAGGANPPKVDKATAKDVVPKTTLYRTLIEAQVAQTVLLSVKHGFLDISANGVQVLTADSPYSSQQQVQFELQKGLNLVEVAFRKLRTKDAHPSVFVYDMTGQVLSGARFAKDEAELQALWSSWEAAHAADANAVRVQAVPNLMQFSPKEIRVKAGRPVRLVFENPDLMQHNLVVVEFGADEEVGALADQMAAKPEGFAKNFVPESPKILFATPLVNPNGRAELLFTAPVSPGSYPYLCTFPGHWRVMRGVLMVE